jgi:fumarate reductase flavoprotein subunit
MESKIDRRQFIGGAGIIAASGAIGILTGCSPQQEQPTVEEEPNSNNTGNTTPAVIDQEIDCDIVVVGAGGSGLAACVEAAEQGKKVLCVESQSAPGGNENIVEGIFAVDSRMQLEQGLSFDTGSIVRQELASGQYRTSGPGFVDMIDASGNNVNWLLDHGVKIWRVDADKGTEPFFHRFEETAGGVGYVPPMTEAAEKAGVEFLFETHGDSLVVAQDGSICGLYATKNDSTVLQINARAVIIATGGFADNDEYMSEMGYNVETMGRMAMPGHDGSGHTMAVEVGAVSYISSAAAVADLSIPGLPLFFESGKFNPYFCSRYPVTLWLTETGERFLNEDFALVNNMFPPVPTLWQSQTYVFVDQALMDAWTSGEATGSLFADNAVLYGEGMTPLDELQSGIDSGVFLKAATLEDLAQQAGFDSKVLKTTIERYNESVAAGSDKDFGKDPQFLKAIGDGPYYLAKPTQNICAPVGSIRTNRDFSAVDSSNNPIKGLYVVGVEGSMLWANVYTINISGGCNANNVNSARTAVNHAITNLL